MSALHARLHAPMADGATRVRALTPADREPLRASCAADPDIWAIYPYSMLGDAFDPAFDRLMATDQTTLKFAILQEGALVGCTSYLRLDPENAVVEIGGTYIQPSVRGTGLNRCVKELLLARAFMCGLHRVEFRVDTRNTRSQAAVRKLGAHQDGVIRQDRLTWTGYRRDTALFSILKSEWHHQKG